MRVDPEVQDLKFESDLHTVRAQESQLRAWGIFIIRVAKPEIDFLIVPRRTLRLTLFVGMQIQGVAIPTLTPRAFGVRVRLDDYDQRAPSVMFCDPWTWQPLNDTEIMRANVYGPGGALMNVVVADHPSTKRPFLCIRGVREYHEHPQHTGDDWAQYRSSTSLFTLLQRIRQMFIVDVFPNFIVRPDAPNKGLNILLQWESELRK